MNVEAHRELTAEPTRTHIDLPGLLAMRCYAAMAIMLFHLIALPKLQIPAYLSFVPTNFSLGVPLFYTVSAFGLFVGYAGRIGSRAELREFYILRFLRIAPLFYDGFLLSIVLDTGRQAVPDLPVHQFWTVHLQFSA